MKKMFIFLITALMFLPFLSTFSISAKAEANPIYAKVTYQNVYFYSLPDADEENKLFILPHTYFVKLLSSENDEFYYAQYEDIFGYVLKNSVTAMNGTPATPFATANFRIFSLEGIGLYKKPNMTEEKLADIPYLSEGLTYYGTMQGQEVIPEKSNQWYFAKFTTTSSYGYVYSVFCDKLPQIAENKESFEVIETPLFEKDSSQQELSPISMTFIIIGVSLPCLIVLYLLVKPTMMKEKLTKARPKMKAKGRRDYFEFDEGDLN